MHHRITAQELLCLENVSDAQLSPDGSQIAFVQRTRNWEPKSTHHRIWKIELATGTESPLSPDAEACASPRWSPDGHTLVWLNYAKGACRLQLVPAFVDSTSELQSIDLLPGAHSITWCPDAKRLAFLAPAAAARSPVEGIREIGSDAPRTDLCVLDPVTTSWKRLALGPLSVSDYSWSPSGDQIAICATPTSLPTDWDQGDLLIIERSSSEPKRLLTGRCKRAIWSPDGGTLAVVRLGQRSFLDPPTLEMVDLEGAVTSFDPFDEEFQLLDWGKQGLIALSVEGCSSHLYQVSPSTGEAKRIMPDAPLGFSLIEGWFGQGCTLSQDGQMMAFTGYDAAHPSEVTLLQLESGQTRILTSAMQTFYDWNLPTPEILTWEASDGTPLSGVLIRPDSDDKQIPRPLVIALHGGPTAMASQAPLADNDWIWAAIPLMLQRGAMVLLPDYRGSIGYGSSFRQMNQHRIGLANLDDIQSAIESLAAKGWVNARRVGAVGASHGGYLSALLATATDCLAAAVCRSGITDWTLNYQLNQNPTWERQYFGGTPWDQPERYRAASPINYVSQASTPILFVHGDQDQQAPTANAYALHRALEDQGVPSKLVILEGTGHGGGTLQQLAYGIEQTVQWFEQWLEMS